MTSLPELYRPNDPSINPFDAGGQFAWDATSFNLAQTCLRKYYYRMVQGWVPARRSVHLIFGGHYATALEHFYKHLAEGMDRDEALVEVIWETLRNTWAPVYANSEDSRLRRNPIPGRGAPWQSDDANKTRETLIRTIIWYVDHFAEDNCKTVHTSDGKPAVEHSFKLEIDPGILWCGHMDRLVDYGGDYYVMDQKTTKGTVGTYWFEQWGTDDQMSGYTFAGKIIYDMPVKGVIIDAAQIAVGFSRFERGFTNRNGGQLDEWLDETLHNIEAHRLAYQENYWPRRNTSCNNYGGCEFRSVCSRAPSVREQFLKAKFVRGDKWNPLEER